MDLLFAGWTPEQVKTWICWFFDKSVGEKFVEEERWKGVVKQTLGGGFNT